MLLLIFYEECGYPGILKSPAIWTLQSSSTFTMASEIANLLACMQKAKRVFVKFHVVELFK